MPGRVSLPGAAELFRPTAPDATTPGDAAEARSTRKPAARGRHKAVVPPFEHALPPENAVRAEPDTSAADQPAPDETPTRRRSASGRVRHDEKITVYVSTEELLALETGRLSLRGEHGLAVDRGRIVRESIALAMADLAARGADSDLVRRLNGQ